jgi:7-keto-8-aminopelargonate synthetase-like enzyme
MKLDEKGLEAAAKQVERSSIYGDGYEGAEAAIQAYLKATDTVLVPREASEETIKAIKDWPHSYVHGPRSFYRAMIHAAEGEE